MSTMKRHSSSVIPGVEVPGNCTTGLRMESPTQVTKVSRWPNPSSTCCATRSMSAVLVASPVRANAFRPRACTSSATLLTPVGVRALTATSAPASANARAMPLPMPRPPPTINTFCPVMSNSGMLIMLSLAVPNSHGPGSRPPARPSKRSCFRTFSVGKKSLGSYRMRCSSTTRRRRSLVWATECRCASLTTSLAVTRRDVALQPPVDERLPGHIGAALEAGGILEAGWSGMVDNRMFHQAQALASSHVRVGVGAGRLTRWAGKGRIGRRQFVEPEFGHAVKGPILGIGGEGDDVPSQPRELLGQCPVLAQPPVEEDRLEELRPALQIDDHALHSGPPHVTSPRWRRPGVRSAGRWCCSAAAAGPRCYGNTAPRGPKTWE